MNLVYKPLLMDTRHMIAYERMRMEAFGFEPSFCEEYAKKMFPMMARQGSKSFVAVGLFVDDTLDAVAYVSNSHDSFYIEQLFVRKSKQNKHLHLGRILLQFILDDKESFEAYFEQVFSVSSLTPIDEKSIKIYTSLGYQPVSKQFGIYRKSL